MSFNTPESCQPEVGGLTTFTRAKAECDGDCQLCIETERDDRAVTYFVSHEDNCVCPLPTSAPDAGVASSPAADASSPTTLPPDGGDAAAAPDTTHDAGTAAPTPNDAGAAPSTAAPDGCNSRLHLTRSEADAVCEDWDDCHVCVERINLENDPRSYLAHQCGCPDPYRLPL